MIIGSIPNVHSLPEDIHLQEAQPFLNNELYIDSPKVTLNNDVNQMTSSRNNN